MKRLEEYLSNMTSDFSDGTNGEPSAPGRFDGGDTGQTVGLPDYKYVERQKKRHDRLKALAQRRDPEGLSKNPVDVRLRSIIGESRTHLNFSSWFSGSKVVDAQGNPVAVYHSSPAAFKVFDTSREGAHFGTEEQASNLNKPGKREPKAFFLAIKNPVRMPDIGQWNNFNGLHANLSRENIITDEQADAAWAAWQRSDREGWEVLKRAVEENGYDGIVYQNEQEGPGDSYIAFRSDQIIPVEKIRENSPPRRRFKLRRLAEEDEDEDLLKDVEPEMELQPGSTQNYFHVVNPKGYFLGSIHLETERFETIPSLRRLRSEYPWIAVPSGAFTSSPGRFKSKEEAAGYLRDLAQGLGVTGYSEEYWKRGAELRKSE